MSTFIIGPDFLFFFFFFLFSFLNCSTCRFVSNIGWGRRLQTLMVAGWVFTTAVEAPWSHARGHLCRSCQPAQCTHRGLSLQDNAECPNRNQKRLFLISQRSTLLVYLWPTTRPLFTPSQTLGPKSKSLARLLTAYMIIFINKDRSNCKLGLSAQQEL